MATQDPGQVLTAPYPVPGGTAQPYERGISLNRVGSEVVVEFRLPMIGRPYIATGTHSPPDQSGSRDYILPFSTALV